MDLLSVYDLEVGLTVADELGNIGTIVKIDDIHNILVNFITGLVNVCADETCEDYEPLFDPYS